MTMILDKAIGIDLGTTNSVGAVLDQTDRRLIFARHGSEQKDTLLPSAVAWIPELDRTVVGRDARARRFLTPPPIISPKRGMGKEVMYRLKEQDVSPAQVSGLILKEMVEHIRAALRHESWNVDVRRAVITIPAHFKAPPADDTRRAGEAAGLEVVELLHEPVAAVLHYCWQRSQERRRSGRGTDDDREELFLVFDMGGGTFDVSVLHKVPIPGAGCDIHTLAIGGDSFLGGDDLDRAIAQDMFDRLAKQGFHFNTLEQGPPQNDLRWSILIALAEQLKIQLSSKPSAAVHRKDLFQDDRGKPVEIHLTYEQWEFEKIIGQVVERTIPFCRSALREAKVDISHIDEILMIGGSALVPLVKRRVMAEFCNAASPTRARCTEPTIHEPALCVGGGAALKAASLGRIYRHPSRSPVVRVAGYGGSAKTIVPLRVESLDTTTTQTVKMGTANLQARGGATQSVPCRGEGVFLFPKVELAPAQTTFFDLQLRDPAGMSLAECEIPLHQDPLFVEPIGVNTSANVLSYTLSLEVCDSQKNELHRVELAPKLTPLPKRDMKFEFSYPGDTQVVHLPLYGDGLEIRTIPVPTDVRTPHGALVRLFVSVESNQKVICRVEIPDAPSHRQFPFEVPPPAPPKLPTPDELEALKARSEALLSQYRRPDVAKRAMRHAQLFAEIQRAIEQRDAARAIQRVEDVKLLLLEIDPSTQKVHPPREELVELANRCRDIIQVLRQTPACQFNLDEIEKDLAANQTAAEDAAKESPVHQEAYSRAFENIKRQHDACLDEYRAHNKVTPAERATMLIQHANENLEKLSGRRLSDEQRARLDGSRKTVEDASNQLAHGKPEDACSAASSAAQVLTQIAKELDVDAGTVEGGKVVLLTREPTGPSPIDSPPGFGAI